MVSGFYILPFDVRDRKLAAASLESLPEEWKAIDVLVNNAGLVIGVDKEFEGSLDEWDIMIDTNIRGLLAMTRLVVPGMVERGRGHIINIGSIAGDAAYPGGSVYCATKAAVKALSDRLRIESGGHSIESDECQTGNGGDKLYSGALSGR